MLFQVVFDTKPAIMLRFPPPEIICLFTVNVYSLNFITYVAGKTRNIEAPFEISEDTSLFESLE